MPKLLVVEDDLLFSKQLETSLKREGFVLTLTSRVEDALRHVETGDVDVVLADYYLVESTALDFINDLRKITTKLPVIVMTSKHTTEMAISTTKHGAYDYFPKPDVDDYVNGTPGSWPWLEELVCVLESAASSKQLMESVHLPGETTVYATDSRSDRMLGKSKAM